LRKGETLKNILLQFYSVSITIEKSSRHWPMCEYCSHEATAACIDDIKKVMEALAMNHVTFEYMNIIYTRTGECIRRMTRDILVLIISSNTG